MLDAPSSMSWPRVCHEHSVTLDCGAKNERDPIPIEFYIDGVAYTSNIAGRSGSIEGCWIINLANEK
eukprot:9046081-Pyramimonas_sp.AAC.1